MRWFLQLSDLQTCQGGENPAWFFPLYHWVTKTLQLGKSLVWPCLMHQQPIWSLTLTTALGNTGCESEKRRQEAQIPSSALLLYITPAFHMGYWDITRGGEWVPQYRHTCPVLPSFPFISLCAGDGLREGVRSTAIHLWRFSLLWTVKLPTECSKSAAVK